ncbi:MAG: hypothetical protein R2715_16115 [Ilumatobacteraceae bacterium]
MTADAQTHLAEEVASGELTQDEADARLADVTARVTERVQTVPGEGEGPDRATGRAPATRHPGRCTGRPAGPGGGGGGILEAAGSLRGGGNLPPPHGSSGGSDIMTTNDHTPHHDPALDGFGT